MARQRNPNDPYDSDAASDKLRRRRAGQVENERQADPELSEGPASGGRMALFAIAIVAILGVVFYGLNNPSVTSTPTAQTTSPAPTTGTAATRAPAGQTTGSAMSPSAPPPPATYGDNTKGDTSGATQLSPGPAPSESGAAPSTPPANN